MQKMQVTTAHPDNLKVYDQQLAAIKRLQTGYTQMVNGQAQVIPGLDKMFQATGLFGVETMKSVSASQAFTKSLMDQKVGLGQVVTGFTNFRNQLRLATQEQAALQRASAMQWTNNGIGAKNEISMYVPQNVGNALVDMKTKYGMINYSIGQIANNTLNWGKNTQWAGRQLTAGLSMPIALAAAGLASLGNQVDQQLTRINKVINTQSSQISDPVQRQIAQEKELGQVRQQSMQLAVNMAQQYGQAATETLSTEADLAAIGKTGNELMASTAQVTRIATLGELDHNTAMQMTITLMSAFKMNAAQLGDAFNYINAVENNTSLTTKDFADAIPRAGSALASVGVNLQQFGILLTALKEGGVNADQGANALKSGLSRILQPTQQAVTAFNALHINIKEVVDNAKGDLFKVLETLGQKMQGADQQLRLTALKDLFGTYQVNRLNVVLNNLSDALAGVSTGASQTAEAVKIAGQGAGSWADTANNEIKTLNESISQKFKIAVQTMKTELSSAGMSILQVITPIINGFNFLVNLFNNAPSWVHKLAGFAAVVAGIAGPVIMLTGLFANWWGNIGKLATGFANLFLKFKPLTAEQAAQEQVSKIATQNWDLQAKSVAILTQRVQDLTTAMMQQLKIQGAALGLPLTAATAATGGTSNGLLPTNASNGALRNAATGQFVSPNAVKDAEQLAKATTDAASSQREMAAASTEAATAADGADPSLEGYNNSVYHLNENTKESVRVGREAGATFKMVAATLSATAVGVMGFEQLKKGTADWFTSLLDVSLILGALEAGGVFRFLKAGITDLAAGTAADSKIFAAFGKAATAALDGIALGFNAVKSTAIWLFTNPFGIAIVALTALAAALYFAHQKATELARDQAALANTGKMWSDILGFTNTPISLQDHTPLGLLSTTASEIQKMAPIVKQMDQGVKDALSASTGINDLFMRAMQQSLQVRANGGSVANAKTAFVASLVAGGADEADIQSLTLRYDSVKLANANDVVTEAEKEIQFAFDQQDSNHLTEVQLNLGAKIAYNFSHLFGSGNGLTDAGTATITRLGANLNMAIAAAVGNPDAMKQVGDGFSTNWNKMWGDTFDKLQQNNSALFKRMGIKSMDDLVKAVQDAQKAAGTSWNPFDWGHATGDQKQLVLQTSDDLKTYTNGVKQMAQQVGTALGHTGTDLDNFIAKHKTLKSLLEAMGVPEMSLTAAINAYNMAVNNGIMSGHRMSDAQQLATLNTYRAKAGLDAATTVAQGFAAAADHAAASARGAAFAMTQWADALNTDWAMNNMSGDQYSSMIKDAMGGAQSFMMQQAMALADRHEQAVEKSIQDAGQATVNGYKQQEKDTTAYYDNLSKQLDDWDKAQQKAINDKYDALGKTYDNDIKAAQDAAKAKTDAIQSEIDALTKDDTKRQELFQNEQNRIERLAQMANNNIDFNSALNSGNLDEAAKVYNNSMAEQQSNMLQDQQQKMDDASKAEQDLLKQKMDNINAETDAYVQMMTDKKNALDAQKQAELDALDATYQKSKDTYDKEKQDALDALTAKEDATNTATQNQLAAQQQTYQDEKTKVQLTLDTLNAAVVTSSGDYWSLANQVRTTMKGLGVDLDNYAGAWTGDLGMALQSNIDRARIAASDGAKWTQMGQYIQQMIDAGTGFGLDQVLTYLKTGQWPAQSQPASKTPAPTGGPLTGYTNGNWLGGLINNVLGRPNPPKPNPSNSGQIPGLPPIPGHHEGGVAGGRSSRGNIPWSAPLQPSETLALLQKGEFVVNRDATAKNMDLLTALNSGMPVRHGGGPVLGGVADGIAYAVITNMMLRADLMATAAGNALAKQLALQMILGSLSPGAIAGGLSMPGAAPTAVSGNKKTVMDMAASVYGWTGAEWNALYAVIMRESGFRNTAQNPTSTAYGMFQFLNSTWAGYGIPKTSDPYLQSVAGLRYIKARYGDPLGALAHEKAYGWYDGGGYLKPGMIGLNGTGKPEPVFTAEQWQIMSSLVAQSVNGAGASKELCNAISELKASIDSGTNTTYTVNVDMAGANINSDVDMEKAVYKALVKIDNKNGRSRTIS